MTSLKWKVSCEHVYAIYQAYTWYKYRSIVYIRYIPGIKHAYTFHMTTYSIYLTYTYSKLSATFRYQSRYGLVMEYTWYIPGISIYQVYTWYMTFLLAYTRYIPDIYQVYTWWLMLWRQTWPHAARATSNHITGPCHYCNSFRFITCAHFTFAHVSVHRPFRHKERRETPFFARIAHKVFHLGQYR